MENPPSPAALDRVRELGAKESGLAVVATTRRDGSVQASLVNAGVVDHPMTGEPVVAFVVRGHANKLVNLRSRPRITFVFRCGWEWVAVEGNADLAGPDDQLEGLEPGDIAGLLRAIYAASAGGAAEDWQPLDDVIASERHTAVLVRPVRIYSNAGAP
jgi:hypothetical protein